LSFVVLESAAAAATSQVGGGDSELTIQLPLPFPPPPDIIITCDDDDDDDDKLIGDNDINGEVSGVEQVSSAFDHLVRQHLHAPTLDAAP